MIPETQRLLGGKEEEKGEGFIVEKSLSTWTFPKLINEFVGTFFLIVTISLTVGQSKALAALAIGSVLAVFIYAGGHVSGAHYNPAVTLAFYLGAKGRDITFTAVDIIMYWTFQLLGGVVAALVAYLISGNHVALTVDPALTGAAFILEVLFTFALAYVVLGSATLAAEKGPNSFYGFAIGFTVFAGAVSAGSISNGVFNPAVATGLIVVDLMFGGKSDLVWIFGYWTAELIGGALAALVFYVTHSDDEKEYPKKSHAPVPSEEP